MTHKFMTLSIKSHSTQGTYAVVKDKAMQSCETVSDAELISVQNTVAAN